MPKYEVAITAILPKTSKSSTLTSTVVAGDVPLAIAKMIDGIFSDGRRKGTVIWYRDYNNAAFPRGYHKSEKSILIAAIRKDADKYPTAMAFPPNFKTPRITVSEIREEPIPETPKKSPPKQLTLFAHGKKYVSADEDIYMPEMTLDKTQVEEIIEEEEGEEKKEQVKAWALFYRVMSNKGLNAFLAYRPKSDDPEENDANNALLKNLRDTDSWILSDGGPTLKLPETAVKGEITVSDLRGGSATQRKIEAYVDGDVAYVEVGKAFEGAPPVMSSPPAGGG